MLSWLLWVVPVLVMDFCVAPVLAFIAPLAPQKFPWSVTPDNPVDGDAGHTERTKGWFPYARRVWWLLRNRAYGFKLGPAGCKAQGYIAYGNPAIKNRDDAVAGWTLLIGLRWNWYYKEVWHIPRTQYCIQLGLGWQLDSPINGRCLFMLSPRVTKFYRSSNG